MSSAMTSAVTVRAQWLPASELSLCTEYIYRSSPPSLKWALLSSALRGGKPETCHCQRGSPPGVLAPGSVHLGLDYSGPVRDKSLHPLNSCVIKELYNETIHLLSVFTGFCQQELES